MNQGQLVHKGQYVSHKDQINRQEHIPRSTIHPQASFTLPVCSQRGLASSVSQQILSWMLMCSEHKIGATPGARNLPPSLGASAETHWVILLLRVENWILLPGQPVFNSLQRR